MSGSEDACILNVGWTFLPCFESISFSSSSKLRPRSVLYIVIGVSLPFCHTGGALP